MMEAIVLSGGLGTRLLKVVSDLPKPMAPVNGRPFLYYLLQWLSKHGVGRIIISAGYKSEVIKNYFGNSFGKIPVDYAIEDKLLGTGGAVINSLKFTVDSNVLIVNGDTWFPIDLNEFWSRHTTFGHIFSIALKRMQDNSRYGAVETEGHTITGFREKSHLAEGLINGGIYLSRRDFFETRVFPEQFSLEKDLLAREAGKGTLKGLIFDDPFLDIGVPEDYLGAGSIIRDE